MAIGALKRHHLVNVELSTGNPTKVEDLLLKVPHDLTQL